MKDNFLLGPTYYISNQWQLSAFHQAIKSGPFFVWNFNKGGVKYFLPTV